MSEPDWVDDEGLSRDETLARFGALHPKPTHGPNVGETPRHALTFTPGTTYTRTLPTGESIRWGIRDKATGRVQRSAGPVDGELDDGAEYVYRYVTPWTRATDPPR